MDSICGEEVKFISYLQATFGRWEKQMLFLSRLGDPRNSFLIYFPAAFHVDSSLGLNVLWSAILSEWCNLILKWILRGDRPYWWIHEAGQSLNINLTQYELTCETGPGAPSGHVMVTASVWFLMIAFLAMQLNSTFSQSKQLHRLSQATLVASTWAVFVSIVALVSMSRVFIATHFPHQVLLGVVVGVSLSYIVKRSGRFARLTNLLECCLVSLILVVLSLICYYVLSIALYDPSVSLRKAQSWCVDQSYIHTDTTPFYALVRDAGAACGIGLAYYMTSVCSLAKPLSLRRVPIRAAARLDSGSEGFLYRGLKIFLSLSSLQVLESIALPTSHIVIFYVTGYAKNVFLPITVIFLVPYICRLVGNRCGKMCSWHTKRQ